MVSTKPYLLRAIYEWCVDQGFTPHLAVAVDERARVPRDHVRDGEIVLNIGTAATQHLVIGNEEITFQARFNGVVFPVAVPVATVAAIYARENGQGLAFELENPAAEEPRQEAAPAEADAEAPAPPPGRPHLTRIK